ncbi:krab-a domain-containing protein [Pseudoloma neurophilia]|uniref:Krab-a domain-containing protein n=1 Tax=Pseudoloma neurophilia TaxID=146866 RepID=A0A0R0M0J7_9MICR|nr:krab-a domain-containing protein [Pseudoloma neurophilia]
MNNEFINLKQEISDMENLYLPDYKKPFVLRTDASNTGTGAVLYQVGKKGEERPIEWASKKLTATEARYDISEREMLAIYWALKKFEYELRGRKFKLETDHKALIEIHKKPQFNNNRINRWIELIQEFDFEIVHIKGEKMGRADQLSRVNEKDQKKWQKGRRIREGKEIKHQKEEKGKIYLTFDSGEKREVLGEENREKKQ